MNMTLKLTEIKTTCTLCKKFHRLKIKLSDYCYMVYIYKDPKDLKKHVEKYEGKKSKTVSGAFLYNLKARTDKKIGTIVLNFQVLTNALIIHECTHASLSYITTVFNNNAKTVLIKNERQEEFLCDLVSILHSEITYYTSNSYRTLYTRLGKNL